MEHNIYPFEVESNQETERKKLPIFLLATIMSQMAFLIGAFSPSPVAQRVSSDKLAIRFSTPSLNSRLDDELLVPVRSPYKSNIVTIRSGSNLASILSPFGFKEISHLNSLLAKIDRDVLIPGEKIEIFKGTEIEEIRFYKKNLELIVYDTKAKKIERLLPEIKSEEKTVSGIINTSLAATASKQGVPYKVIDELVDAFASDINFSKSIKKQDTFTLVFDQKVSKNQAHLDASVVKYRDATLKSAVFSVGGKKFYAISDGKGGFFDQNGEPKDNYFLRYPLKFSRISSVFSTSRFHPVLHRFRAHNGVDFAAPTGTPVRTIGDGVVTHASYAGGGGLTVRIRHDNRFTTAYLHLSKIKPGIRPGVRVKKGEFIGNVGSTGTATGPHLHFSLYDRGKFVDPMKAELPRLRNGDKLSGVILATELQRLKAVGETFARANQISSKKANREG